MVIACTGKVFSKIVAGVSEAHTINDSFEQFSKAFSPIDTSAKGNSTVFSLEQFLKASIPIVLTLSGITTFSRVLKP